MNKYQEALDRLETISSEDIGEVLVGEILNNEIKTLQELIDMHNKPLKREEIKKGMWVWDSEEKAYVKVFEILENGEYFFGEALVIDYNEYIYEKPFNPNCFYRYQPLSEV